MLHALGSCGANWMYQIPYFQSEYEVITIDMRGHGRSSKPQGPYSISTFAEDVAHLLSSLEIGPAHVIGFSLGSFVALQLACDFPHLVKTLTLTGTTSSVQDIGRWTLFFRRLLLRFCSMKTAAAVIAYSLFPRPNQAWIRAMCKQKIASNDKRVYTCVLQELSHFNVKERLKEISCPVLVVVGTEDSLTPSWHAEAIVKRVKHGEMAFIEGSAHACPLDAPEKFNALVLAFLQRH